ncbi:helix-turn-helix domain-containing protein [Herbaspirillum sp. YR522]|uniref:helix-turn-helix domain-containing protein n=1 Tax=Herbaspirillum sp. YR522 TaxID=1144342 RepID=UPI00026F5C3C|nr:helix-turn-helix transcriptional regulator [Herbaspirillum sp. YR522]EJN08338.1 putative transcriptional regulator [Herbaspirillum sp. YR522]
MAINISQPLTSHPLLTTSQLGQLLVSARKRKRLTQAEVATRLGLSQNRISHLEHNPDEISAKQLLGWCAALELDLRLGTRARAPLDTSLEW